LNDICINISLIFHSSAMFVCVCVCAMYVCMITNHVDAFGHKKSARAGLKQLSAGIHQRYVNIPVCASALRSRAHTHSTHNTRGYHRAHPEAGRSLIFKRAGRHPGTWMRSRHVTIETLSISSIVFGVMISLCQSLNFLRFQIKI
jgi:hypothetical protein